MEYDARNIASPILSTDNVKRVLERIESAVDDGQKRLDYATAHDPEVGRAIAVVERFLRHKQRVCYGGQAINALLPKEKQFYDEKYSIPDYDFFTPTFDEDTNELVKLLKDAGCKDVYKKFSVHDGTSKVLVNFIPVADCTRIHPDLFNIIHSRAKHINGILYADPDFLRMMMYLELSRPRGQLSRWKKVFERLTLLNNAYPIGKCTDELRTLVLPQDDRKTILEFCVKRKCVLVGPECINIMERGRGSVHIDSLAKYGPVMFLSSNPQVDAADLKDILGSLKVEEKLTLTHELFNFVTLHRGGKPVAILFQENACHSYLTLKIKGTGYLRIGSYDLLLHLYYSIMLFGKKEKQFFGMPLICLIEKIHAIADHARAHPTEFMPAFPIHCSGHQTGIATLLKARHKRTTNERKGKNYTRKSRTRTRSMRTRSVHTRGRGSKAQ